MAADNGAAWRLIVESTIRCAHSDGFTTSALGVVSYDADQVHPSLAAARKMCWDHMQGLPTQKHEHVVEHAFPFVFSAEMLQACGIDEIEFEEMGEDGEVEVRRIVATSSESETMAEVLGNDE
jgi:hypothetical protein